MKDNGTLIVAEALLAYSLRNNRSPSHGAIVVACSFRWVLCLLFLSKAI